MAVPAEQGYLKRGRWLTQATMQGKLCVVTGGTSGIGLAAVRRLAVGGANLVLVARSRDKAEAVKAELEETCPVSVAYVIADFMRLSDVRCAAEIIREQYPVIDVLINCAGLFSTRRRMTADGHEMTFQVNHLASFLLTMLLLDTIGRSDQGRILQVNSAGHRFGGLRLDDLDWQIRPYRWPQAYGASKLAQLMTMQTLGERLRDTAVTINAMHPGLVGTNIVQNSGSLLRWLMRNCKRVLLRDPAASGEELYTLVAAPELAQVTGKYFNKTTEAAPHPAVRNEALRTQIWEASLALTGLAQDR